MPDSTDLPTLRFSYPEELHRKAVAVLDAVEQAAEPTAHRKALGDLVVELTGAGLRLQTFAGAAEWPSTRPME